MTAPRMALKQTERTDPLVDSSYEETVHASRHRTVWGFVCLSLTCVCFAARHGQAYGFAPWRDFLLNLFQH